MIEAVSFSNIQNLNIYKKIEKAQESISQTSCSGCSNKEIKDEAIISDEAKSLDKKELTDEEKRKIEELKKTDQRVKTHEQAHMAAATGLNPSGPHYKYEKGPDGEKYAVKGEVHIKTEKEKDPEDTIKKAEQIKKAALAPAEPSSQDLKMAQKADQMKMQAEQELAKKRSDL